MWSRLCYAFNGLVVKIALHLMAISHTFRDLLRYAAWATVFGLAADFCGFFVYELLGQRPFAEAYPLISIIAVATPLIFAVNYLLSRRLLDLASRESVILALVMAVVTSPWTVFLAALF